MQALTCGGTPCGDEWVTYAAYRQGPHLPAPAGVQPAGSNRSIPRIRRRFPHGDWDVAVFDNRFPSLSLSSAPPPSLIVPTASAVGTLRGGGFYKRCACLARCTCRSPTSTYCCKCGRTALSRLAERSEIAYVLPFENRGAEVGVTLHHPHGQIYAYPVVPPVPARMQQEAQLYYQRKGRGVLQDLIEAERAERTRMIYEGPHAVAFVPVCARYPYEVWIAPIDPVENFVQLDSDSAR